MKHLYDRGIQFMPFYFKFRGIIYKRNIVPILFEHLLLNLLATFVGQNNVAIPLELLVYLSHCLCIDAFKLTAIPLSCGQAEKSHLIITVHCQFRFLEKLGLLLFFARDPLQNL